MSVICTCMSSSSSASVNEIGRVYRNEVEVQGRKAARTTVRLIFFLSFFALLRFVFLPHSFDFAILYLSSLPSLTTHPNTLRRRYSLLTSISSPQSPVERWEPRPSTTLFSSATIPTSLRFLALLKPPKHPLHHSHHGPSPFTICQPQRKRVRRPSRRSTSPRYQEYFNPMQERRGGSTRIP